MATSLFVRTYWKDLDWLQLCLRSIDRYCCGFAEVVVAVPESSRPWMLRSTLPGAARLVYIPTYADDYLGQQVTKLNADLYTAAAFIAHVDADCIFVRSTRPEDLAPDGRPRLATRPIAELGRHYPWRRPTETFLGFPVELDFMQQPPFVYPRWLYPLLRDHCLATHGVSIERYVTSRPPRGFSEFNVLGAYAFRHHAEHFDFPTIGTPSAPPSHCDWYWSWGGITPEIRRRIEARLEAETSA
jgi:hypothetical protein